MHDTYLTSVPLHCVAKPTHFDFQFEVFNDTVIHKSDFFYFILEMVHYI